MSLQRLADVRDVTVAPNFRVPGSPRRRVMFRDSSTQLAIFAVMVQPPERWRIHELDAYELPATRSRKSGAGACAGGDTLCRRPIA